MASVAFSNRLYRLDRSRLWSDEGLQTFLGSLRGFFVSFGFSLSVHLQHALEEVIVRVGQQSFSGDIPLT